MSGKLSCTVAAVILTLMLVTIFANAIYIKNTADNILTLIDSSENFESNSRSSATVISEYWNNRIPILKLSLSQKEIEDISLNINEAIICAENQDEEEYQIAMARLRRAIESIKKREEFSIENIF